MLQPIGGAFPAALVASALRLASSGTSRSRAERAAIVTGSGRVRQSPCGGPRPARGRTRGGRAAPPAALCRGRTRSIDGGLFLVSGK